MNMEIRFQEMDMTANSDNTLTVSGYVNKTGQPSGVLGSSKKFVEKIAKGAFQKAIINRNKDIDFLAEHKKDLILSSTRNGSLMLTEDDQGLYMEATITPTSWGKDYYELIQSKILQNMSFGFRTVKDSWTAVQPGLYERIIEELELFEVSVVRNPAYSQSTIAARGIDVVEEIEIPDEVEEESRTMEKVDEILGKLDALEERFGEVLEELKEIRSAEADEKEEETQTDQEEIKEEIDTEKDPSDETDTETKTEEDTEKSEEDETSEEDKAEETEKKEETKPAEETKDETKVETDEAEDEIEDEEEETKTERSEKPNYLEFRNKLASLK